MAHRVPELVAMRASPRQLVALTLFFAAGCRTGAPPLPPALSPLCPPIQIDERPTTVRVDALWVQDGDPPRGGTSPITLTTAANTRGQVRVGFFEEFADGIGPQWRVGVWLAAFVAASTLDRDLLDITFTAESAGHVDGASASALMTAAYLATLTGAPITPGVTMTGIIQPDGTIGPVGGLPEKIAGGIASGAHRIGFPAGMRMADDAAGNRVDLVELARRAGGEAIEIADVHDAVELLTGRSLPRPVPVDVEAMQLSPDEIDTADRAARAWRTLLAAEWRRLDGFRARGRLPRELAPVLDAAHAHAAETVEAWTLAASASEVAALTERVLAGDLTGALARLDELEGSAALAERAVREVGSRAARARDPVDAVAAFTPAVIALAARINAADELAHARVRLRDLAARSTPPSAGDIVALLAPAVLDATRATAAATEAVRAARALAPSPSPSPRTPPAVRRLATSFQSAAAANVSYFEALLHVDGDRQRRSVAARERDYLVAYTAAQLPRMSGVPAALASEWGSGSAPWSLFTLAAEQLAYVKASALISRWYSLQAGPDPETGELSLERPEALAPMLAAAERTAREHARAAADATGVIPRAARADYQQARALAAGTLEDQLRALELYWSSSGYSQLAVMFAHR